MDQTYYKPEPLSGPQIYLIRILLFLAVILCLVIVLFGQIARNFLYNPAINGLILLCLFVGLWFAIGQIFRLFSEVRWVNALPGDQHKTHAERDPVLLAAMAGLLRRTREDGGEISTEIMTSILESISTRFRETREIMRYTSGLLVFLGLLGTFWGLTETVGAVGGVIGNLDVSGLDAVDGLSRVTEGIGSAVGGMGTAFSSSLFGLAGSLILGFVALQSGQAQARFHTELEDWLSSMTSDSLSASPEPPVLTMATPRRSVNGELSREAIGRLTEATEALMRHLRQVEVRQGDWSDKLASEQRALRLSIDRLTTLLQKLD